MWDYVKADIRRVTIGESSASRKLGRVLVDPGLHAVLLYRFKRWLYLHHLEPLAMIVGYFSTMITGTQISARATIGKGFAICHPHGIVIGGTAIIGEHCTLVQGNVIGQLHWSEDRPTIGDRFYAGAGAKIFGRVRIGDGVQIGANAVVNRSVPDGGIVAAVPSRLLPGRGIQAHQVIESTSDGARDRDERTTGGSLKRDRSLASDRGAILKRVTSVLATVTDGRDLPSHAIDERMALVDGGVGFSSIELLSFICAIEQEFNVTIDEGEVEVSRFATVGSVVTFIEERTSQ